MSGTVVFQSISRPVKLVYTNTTYPLPAPTQTAVDNHWNKLISSGKKFTRGDVFTIQDIIETPEHVEYNVALTDYAHYLATTAQIDDIQEHPCRVVHTSVLIKTKDNYLGFGEMAEHTSTPKRLQCAGGGITRADLKDGNILGVRENAEAELLEETGLDCHNPEHQCSLRFAYIKSGGTHNFVGAMFIAETQMTADELRSRFEDHNQEIIAKGDKPELAQLILIKNDKNSVLQFLQEDQRLQEDYLATWLKIESQALT